MKDKRTLLLLGGSRQQVPAIEKAKEMGFRTVLIDYLPDNPGQHVADKWYQESTTDVEAVYRIAKEEDVDGILPYASDPAALPAAIVSERLGLSTNPASSVEILGVKHKFREFLRNEDFASPASFTFKPDISLDELNKKVRKLRFPIVIKPTDSSGSKGVSFHNDTDELSQAVCHADEYSRNKVLIAEEFIQRGFPYVIGGDIFIENGKIVLLGDMACMRTDGGTGLIPIGKMKPAGLTDKQEEKIGLELQKLVDKLDIKSGEMNIELILDTDDNVHFLEVGPRAGGNMIPIQLSDAYGVDLIEANIKAAMGLPVNLELKENSDCYLTYVLHCDKDGIFEGVEYDDLIKPYIYRKVIYKEKGDQVEAFDGAGKALGIIFMKFPDSEVMNKIQNKLGSLIQVKLHE